MSRIDQLIAEMCPKGVPIMSLGELAEIANNGVDKKSRTDEQTVWLVNFVDVFNNLELRPSNLTMQVTASERQIESCKLEVGDLLVTPTSESREELARTAVVVEPLPEAVYSYHVMRIRVRALSHLEPKFLSYLFSSSKVQRQIQLSAQGITRFGLTQSKWNDLKFPLPPIEVQKEIVRILDLFTQLESELESELEARHKQYEYYRNALLSTHLPADVEFKTLGELLGPIPRGKRLTKTNLALHGSIPVFHGGLSPIGYHDEANTPGETVMVINTGASSGSVGWSNEPFWCSDGCFALPHSQALLSRYLFHYASLNQKYFTAKVRKAGIPTLASDSILSLKIPVLPLARQIEIVRILDALLDLTSNLSIGLPAEIEARRNQYQYYRDKLLTFPEPAV